MCYISHCRLVLNSFEVCLEERGSEPILAWSSSSNLKCSFLMSPPLDWMLIQLFLSFNFLSGEDTYMYTCTCACVQVLHSLRLLVCVYIDYRDYVYMLYLVMFKVA